MVEAFTGADEVAHRAIFEEMFRQRCDIYVKRRKWADLVVVDGMERDGYDTRDAIYLAALDEDENVLASLRLLETKGPHLLADHFAHLCGGGVPRGSDILELTRFYVAPSVRGRQVRDWMMGVIGAGMFEYCLEHGIRQVSSVIDTFLLTAMLGAGWRVRPLGLPQRYPEGVAVAVLIDVRDEGLRSTRRSRGVAGPVLSTPFQAVPRIRSSDLAARGGRGPARPRLQ